MLIYEYMFLAFLVLRAILLGISDVVFDDALSDIANSFGWDVDPAVERCVTIGHWYVFGQVSYGRHVIWHIS